MRSFIRVIVASGLLFGSLLTAGAVHGLSITTIDNAQYVSGPSPRSTTLNPGEALGPLQVTVKNTGTSTWNKFNGEGSEGVVIGPWPLDNANNRAFDAGATVYRNIPRSIAAGETVTIDLLETLGVVAPTTPGTYPLQWKMYRYNDNARVAFGDPIPSQPLSVTVVTNSNPTFASITAPTSVVVNQSATLSWTANDSDRDRLEWSVGWGDAPPPSHPQGGYICRARVDCPDSQTFSSTHAWTQPGTYAVGLQVTDGNGGTALQSVSVVVSAPASQDNAEYIGGEFPTQTQFKPGETVKMVLKVKNTGSSRWSAEYGDYPGYSIKGLSPEGYAKGVALSSPTKPGEIGSFTAYVTLPTQEGSYRYQWRMQRSDPFTEFGPLIPSQPIILTVSQSALQLNAAPAGGTFPTKTTFAPGEAVELSNIIKNTGTQNWLVCNQLLLEISKANLNIGGQADGSDCTAVYAKPGEQYTFRTLVSLPTTPGTYSYQWQMASRDPGQTIDQANKFGSATALWTVTVAAPTSQEWDAMYIGGSFTGEAPSPIQTTGGKSYTFSLVMENKGTRTWEPMSTALLLYENGIRKKSFLLNNSVPAGGRGVFDNVTIFAPTTPGEYRYVWIMANQNPGEWLSQMKEFGKFAPTTPPLVLNVTASLEKNLPPVIKGISGPSKLSVREMGTWTINAYDPESKPLRYSVEWGDVGVGGDALGSMAPDQTKESQQFQEVTLTHYYTTAGVYSPHFTVMDSANQEVGTSVSVVIRAPSGPIIITPPPPIEIDKEDSKLQQRIKQLEYKISELENKVVDLEKQLFTRRNDNLIGRVKGQVLLQVENNGEAWYVDPATYKKYYLKDGTSAYTALGAFGLGVRNKDLEKIPVGVETRFQLQDSDGDGLDDKLEAGLGTDPKNSDTDGDGHKDGDEVKNGYDPLGEEKRAIDSTLVSRLKGRIILQVENGGQAWYINPTDGKRYYMADGALAYQIMRFLSLGVNNGDLRQIPVGEF